MGTYSIFYDFLSINSRPDWGWPDGVKSGLGLLFIKKVGGYATIEISHVNTNITYRCLKNGDTWTDWIYASGSGMLTYEGGDFYGICGSVKKKLGEPVVTLAGKKESVSRGTFTLPVITSSPTICIAIVHGDDQIKGTTMPAGGTALHDYTYGWGSIKVFYYASGVSGSITGTTGEGGAHSYTLLACITLS